MMNIDIQVTRGAASRNPTVTLPNKNTLLFFKSRETVKGPPIESTAWRQCLHSFTVSGPT
jgi:hypothetical protein